MAPTFSNPAGWTAIWLRCCATKGVVAGGGAPVLYGFLPLVLRHEVVQPCRGGGGAGQFVARPADAAFRPGQPAHRPAWSRAMARSAGRRCCAAARGHGLRCCRAAQTTIVLARNVVVGLRQRRLPHWPASGCNTVLPRRSAPSPPGSNPPADRWPERPQARSASRAPWTPGPWRCSTHRRLRQLRGVGRGVAHPAADAADGPRCWSAPRTRARCHRGRAHQWRAPLALCVPGWLAGLFYFGWIFVWQDFPHGGNPGGAALLLAVLVPGGRGIAPSCWLVAGRPRARLQVVLFTSLPLAFVGRLQSGR